MRDRTKKTNKTSKYDDSIIRIYDHVIINVKSLLLRNKETNTYII